MNARLHSRLTKFVALLALCALTLTAAPRAQAQHSLVSWGLDFYGQVSQTPTTGNYIAVAAGLYSSVAIRSDGRLVAWGDNFNGQVSGPKNDTGTYTAIASGYVHVVAVRSDGRLAAWGLNAA